ncbi:MAG: TIGR00303 family protein [Oscillatoriales cyanobacterium SM2_2_1]|nr:TIGR00303 family protein [Oscillatoriales cyanobacterium SM2_2_1]
MVEIHTQKLWGDRWLEYHIRQRPVFACILGFTETALVPGISAAGLTAADRLRTAIADAEVLTYGFAPFSPLPSLGGGISPAVLTHGILSRLAVSIWLLNAGLPLVPSVPVVNLGGRSPACVSTGQALSGGMVRLLWQQGWRWGELLAPRGAYLILSECVVGGTTTAQAVLTALGYGAEGMVSSSHRHGNAAQKTALVRLGLRHLRSDATPWEVVAAVGDPMQVVVTAMALAASHHSGVLLAGGSQMVAVYALARAWAAAEGWPWHPQRMAIATTPWVIHDPAAAVVTLAQLCHCPPLLSGRYGLHGATSPELAAYAAGYVKEGVGLGSALVLAAGYAQWSERQLLSVLEGSIHRHQYQMTQAGKS